MLRDCGRILQMSYGQVDRLCKMVPNHPTDPWTLPRALNGVADFKREYDNDKDVKRLVDLAMQLEGLPRNSLDPRRGRRDRRPAAGASWSRSTAIRARTCR